MAESGAAPARARALSVRGLGVRLGGRWILRGLDLEVQAGEALALVGPSGAGKSTLARALLGWQAASEGEVWIGDHRWSAMPERERRPLRRATVQMIYQDPARSLDPAMTVAAILAEAGCDDKAAWLRRVGLDPAMLGRRPGELSGGQRQRVAIARAFACRPRLLVADEPTAALDPTTAAQTLGLLAQLRAETGLACLFITHQLAWVRGAAERLAVLSAEGGEGGRIVEIGPTAEVLAGPREALTGALVAAVPRWPV